MTKAAGKKFKAVVEATPDIKNCCQEGFDAFKHNTDKISITERKLCDGSIDIDECLRLKYPKSNRWDYCLSYNNQVYFAEVHRAYPNEISIVLKKLQWLKDWLISEAPEIHKLSAKEPYFWLPTNKCGFSQTSPQARRIAAQGLKLTQKLELK